MPTTQQQRISPLQRRLKWASEDLADPAIRGNPERLEQERQVVLKRLTPHIEEVVQLAWKQLQQDQMSSPSTAPDKRYSTPNFGIRYGRGANFGFARLGLINWLAAAAICLLLSTTWDGPSELDAIEAVAADVQDAIQTAQVQP